MGLVTMGMIEFLFALALGVIVDTVWVALFRAQPVGRYKVTHRGEALFQADTSTGKLRILSKEGRLEVEVKGRSTVLPFAEIAGMEYRVHEHDALLQEFFFGFGLADWWARYRDTVEWFSIAIISTSGQRVLLYVSGQYTQREFLMEWYIELQTWLLTRLGVLVDVEAQSRAAMEEIRGLLKHPRLL
jgi:hypothetical protein